MDLNQMKAELDAVIRTVKAVDSLRPVRFIKEYGGANAEMPVSGWIGVVQIREMNTARSYLGGLLCSGRRGERLRAAVDILLYAPPGESGSGLTRLSLALMAALRSCRVSGCRVSAVSYDPDFGAIYRRVGFEMTCGAEENEDG